MTNGQSIIYVYDAFGNLTEEYSPYNVWSKDYIFLSGEAAAIENASANPCGTCYLSRDHLGTVRMVTDPTTNIITRHDYLPFGDEIQAGWAGRSSQFGAGADNVAQKFTGQYRDPETLNDDFPARYYTAPLMRFLTPDPAGPAAVDPTDPQTWNQYAYVRNNPLVLIDPSGMDTNGIWISIPFDCFYQEVPNNAPVWTCQIRYVWIPAGPSNTLAGGSGAAAAAPPKSQTCPSVPAHPANYPPQSLYHLGVNASKSVYDNLSPDLAKTLAYGALVAPNQPLDFKNQPFPGANPQYRAYGNFGFGVFGNALGFSSTYIKWGAGVASYANMLAHFKLPPSSWGTPLTGAPYGDNPQEQQEIQSGYQWAQMYAAGKCQ